MTASEQDAAGGEPNPTFGETQINLPEGSHVILRQCRACGARNMAPTARFEGDGISATNDHGLIYQCENCGSEARIQDPGALFMAGLIAAFWAAVALWVFHEGPYWYLTHLSYFLEEDAFSYLPLDIGSIALGLAVVGLAGWYIWTGLLGPLRILLLHPAVGENHPLSVDEVVQKAAGTRTTLLSLGLYPLLMWGLLIGVFWGLDAAGIDIRDNSLPQTLGLVGLVAIGFGLRKRLGANLGFMFAGMIFWMAVVVSLVFLLR